MHSKLFITELLKIESNVNVTKKIWLHKQRY